MSFSLIANSLGLAGFSISTILYLLALGYGNYKRVLNIFGFLTFLVSTIVATASLFHASAGADQPMQASLLLTVCLGWLAIAAQRQSRLRMMAAFIAPFVTFILLSQIFTSSSLVTPLESGSAMTLMTLHILSAVVTQAFAVFACAMAILYLWKQRILKLRLIDRITGNIPSLNKLELYMTRLVWAGFVLATFCLISGGVFTRNFVDLQSLSLGAKSLWAVMLWGWLLSVLLSRSLFRASKRRTALICVVGFVAITVSYAALGFFGQIGGF